MSLQQALEVAKLLHVFWHKELCRAPKEQLKDCEFFRQQCQHEITLLEDEVGTPATHRARDNRPRRLPAARSLSNAPPAKTMIGGRTTRANATRENRKTIR